MRKYLKDSTPLRTFLFFVCPLVFILPSHLFAEANKAKENQKKIESTESTPDKELKLFNDVTKRYREASILRIPVEKKISSEWKGKEDVSSGLIFYSSGKFRWETEKPEKNLVVYDGKTLTTVQYASADFPGKNKVARAKIDKKNKAQIFIVDLLTLKDISEKFKIFVENNHDNEILYRLESNEKNLSLRDIKVLLSKKPKLIKEISFKDDIGNITKLSLDEPARDKKKTQQIFKYLVTSNDEVSEL